MTIREETANADSSATHFEHTSAEHTPLFSRDTLYANYFSSAPTFCFDRHVAAVFPDMIRRSVPGYGTVLELIPAIAAECLTPGDRVYDLGCSVGAGLLAVRQALSLATLPKEHLQNELTASTPPAPVKLIGVDTSPEMLSRAKTLFDALPPKTESNSGLQANIHTGLPWQTDFISADISKLQIEPAKLILLNYTLQFLPLNERDQLIKKLFDALTPGGHLLLSEKVIDCDAGIEETLTKYHESFKHSQGYSALEIARKREALENVLVREPTEQHLSRLKNAGFSRVTRLMQCLQFSTFLAVKH